MKLEKELAKLSNLEDFSIDENAVHPETGESVKEVFCAHLPYAIKGHELALATIKNPFAKIIIRLAIEVLTALEKRFCEEEKKD